MFSFLWFNFKFIYFFKQRRFLIITTKNVTKNDLPRLLALTENGQTAVNVLLSLDETYADVVPVRLNQDSISAFM